MSTQGSTKEFLTTAPVLTPPAFPWVRAQETSSWGPGMSIRTYIATAAMQGMLAARAGAIASSDYIALWAVAHADALIAELNKPTK